MPNDVSVEFMKASPSAPSQDAIVTLDSLLLTTIHQIDDITTDYQVWITPSLNCTERTLTLRPK